jgi:AbiV family abortive infection protein
MDEHGAVERVRLACLENAEALLNSAKQMAKTGTAHIAYHLATLALEEIGKSSMIFMSSLDVARDEEDRKRPVDWIDNHERKLFWAIWSPRFDVESPWKGIQQAMDLAKRIHETRLATLYVNPLDPDARLKIPGDHLQNLIAITEARLEMERLKKIRELTPEEKSDLDWFFAATDDPQLRPMIFSKGSLEKQAQFDNKNDSAGWIHWLRTELEEANRLSRELTLKRDEQGSPRG